jgi:hypothetical protein
VNDSFTDIVGIIDHIIKKKTFKLFGFQIVWLRVYPIKVIPEMHRSH